MLKTKPLFFVQAIVSGMAANADEAMAVEEKLFELADDFLDDDVKVHGSHDFEKLEYPKLIEFEVEAILDTPAQLEHLEDGLEIIYGTFGWSWSQPEDFAPEPLVAPTTATQQTLHLEVERSTIRRLQKFVEEGLYYPSIQSSCDFKECILEISLHRDIKTGTDYQKVVSFLAKNAPVSEELLRQAQYVHLKWEGADVPRRN